MDRRWLEANLKRVVFARPDGPYFWRIDVQAVKLMRTSEYEDILRFRLEYHEPDTETGQPELQCGRWWYVEDDWTFDQLIKTCLAAVAMSDEHRRREWLKVDGVAIFNPHQPLQRVSQFPSA